MIREEIYRSNERQSCISGELEEVHPWIYALAGGMFVYIGLADMVDMNIYL